MNYSKAHFIGIAGKGMSATALLLRQWACRFPGPTRDFIRRSAII